MVQHDGQTLLKTPALQSKRPQDAVYTHSPYSTSQAPWTATRCLRLLRPISSKLNTLEKLRRNQENNEDDDLFYDSDYDRKVANQALSVFSGHLPDDTWESNPRPRKKARRTYSTRQRSVHERIGNVNGAEQKRSLAQGFLRTTAFSIEERGTNPSLSQEEEACKATYNVFEEYYDGPRSRKAYALYQRCTAKHIAESSGLFQPRKVTSQNNDERMKLCKGITESLSALLKATHSTLQPKRQGSSSLYATCLRTMPLFIAEEEQFAQMEDPDHDHDTISDIYTHLESMAISDSWKPLRTIVRAHGINYICTAIDQNVLSTGMALEMLRICLQAGAEAEAVIVMRQIARRHAQNLGLNSRPANSRNQSQLLGGFLNLTTQIGDEHHTLRCLSEELSSPLALNAHEPLLINSIAYAMSFVGCATSPDRSAEAIVFLRAVSKASTGSRVDDGSRIAAMRASSALAIKKSSLRHYAQNPATIHPLATREVRTAEGQKIGWNKDTDSPICIDEIMAKLSALLITSHGRSREDEVEVYADVKDLFNAISQESRHFLEITGSMNQSERQRRSVLIVLFAKILSSLTVGMPCDLRPHSDIGEIWALARMSLQNAEISYLGLFLCKVAGLCALDPGSLTFEVIKGLLNSMMRLIKVHSPISGSRLLLQKVAVASAFGFSEASRQASHMEWALGIEESIFGKDCMSPNKNTLRTPAKIIEKSRTAYRWEEGIGEWVTKTPVSAIHQSKSISLQVSKGFDELDGDTLVEEWPMRAPSNGDLEELSPNPKSSQEPATANLLAAKCTTETMKAVSIPAKVVRESAISSAIGSFTSTSLDSAGTSSTIQDDDEEDELSGAGGSQTSAQSTFQILQSNSRGNHPRIPKASADMKRKVRSLLPTAVSRSLAALIDHDDQSSDMEDELGM